VGHQALAKTPSAGIFHAKKAREKSSRSLLQLNKYYLLKLSHAMLFV
jgi:ribosomal protein S20